MLTLRGFVDSDLITRGLGTKYIVEVIDLSKNQTSYDISEYLPNVPFLIQKARDVIETRAINVDDSINKIVINIYEIVDFDISVNVKDIMHKKLIHNITVSRELKK